jgi:hypothetical protein
VAAEVSADHRQVRCANCGTQISAPNAAPTTDSARHARDLLARWSHGPHSPLLTAEGGPAAGARLAPVPTATTAAPTGRTARLDPVHEPRGSHAAAAQHARPAAEPVEIAEPLEEDEALEVRAALDFGPPAANVQAFWGQMLAYGGVLALTIGAAMLLAGYFGGGQWQEYTPTGWLVSTTGQMLLFLGVITLVSGGLEQTTQEVSRRLDALGERIVRIECATRHSQPPGAVRSVPASVGAKR